MNKIDTRFDVTQVTVLETKPRMVRGSTPLTGEVRLFQIADREPTLGIPGTPCRWIMSDFMAQTEVHLHGITVLNAGEIQAELRSKFC